MQEQQQTSLVHLLALRKRQRLSYEASQTLAQRAIPALHVVGLPFAFAHRPMSVFRQDFLVALPEIAVEHPFAVSSGDTLPQQAAGRLAPVADRVSHHLTSAPAQSQPDPPFVLALTHERPQLVQL